MSAASAADPRSAIADDVAKHYSGRKDKGKVERLSSVIYNLKNFNNWCKSTLILRFLRPHDVVLDICCGKGGDFLKWHTGKVSYLVAADVATQSVRHAMKRYNDIRLHKFNATFVACDCFAADIPRALHPDVRFNLVSCQFALHYSFENEERARGLWRNITERAAPGAYFVGTMPDANVLVHKLRASESMSFGNSVYNIQFDEAHAAKVFDASSPFGLRYTFTLTDAVDAVPEYLVHFPTLVRLADEHGWDLELKANFHTWHRDNCNVPEFYNLFSRMRVFNAQGTITPDEWDGAYIYMVFAFRKRGAPTNPAPPPRHYEDKQTRVSRWRNARQGTLSMVGPSRRVQDHDLIEL